MTGHTPAQWRELHAAVTAVHNDPAVSAERRQKAAEVLAMIRRNPAAVAALQEAPPLSSLGFTEMEDWI